MTSSSSAPPGSARPLSGAPGWSSIGRGASPSHVPGCGDPETILAAAPMTAAVQDDFAESEALASAPPTSAYGSHVRKSAQLRETLRRRGRQGSEPEPPVGGR